VKLHSLLIGVTLLLVGACASDRSAKAPATAQDQVAAVTPPPQAVDVEQLPPPPDVVNEEKPAPRPKATKLPDPKAPSKCRGLPQLACINVDDCEWIKRASSTDRDGRPLLDYCGLKTLGGRERFNPDTASVRE
jgi:hypothetical protein